MKYVQQLQPRPKKVPAGIIQQKLEVEPGT